METKGFFAGVKAAVPIMLGYLPVGFAYGVLARGAHLSPELTGAMSLLVYAGSAQFIAVDMLSRGLSGAAVIAAAFLVNLRHLLFSAAMAPRLKGVSSGRLAVIAYGITDETFSVASASYPESGGDPSYLLGLNTVSNLSWFIASILGNLIGASLGDPAGIGLDFALPAMFIYLLVFNIKSGAMAAAALTGGILGVVLMGRAGSWSVITAAVAASLVGVAVEEWRKPSC